MIAPKKCTQSPVRVISGPRRRGTGAGLWRFPICAAEILARSAIRQKQANRRRPKLPRLELRQAEQLPPLCRRGWKLPRPMPATTRRQHACGAGSPRQFRAHRLQPTKLVVARITRHRRARIRSFREPFQNSASLARQCLTPLRRRIPLELQSPRCFSAPFRVSIQKVRPDSPRILS